MPQPSLPRAIPGDNPRTRTVTGPTARAIAERIPESRQDGQGWRLRGICHGHGRRPGLLVFADLRLHRP